MAVDPKDPARTTSAAKELDGEEERRTLRVDFAQAADGSPYELDRQRQAAAKRQPPPKPPDRQTSFAKSLDPDEQRRSVAKTFGRAASGNPEPPGRERAAGSGDERHMPTAQQHLRPDGGLARHVVDRNTDRALQAREDRLAMQANEALRQRAKAKTRAGQEHEPHRHRRHR
jgi:hypothetical protein